MLPKIDGGRVEGKSGLHVLTYLSIRIASPMRFGPLSYRRGVMRLARSTRIIKRNWWSCTELSLARQLSWTHSRIQSRNSCVSRFET